MTRRASAILAAVVLVGLSGGGVAIFSAFSTSANPFNGPFGSSGSGDSPTYTAIQEALLGQPLGADSLTLTQSNPSLATLTLAGGRFYLYPPGDAANAYMYYDGTALRLVFAGVILGGNVPLTVDILTSTVPSTKPVTVEASAGLRLACQGSLPTCGSGDITQGTTIALCATATSRTRTCTCTADDDSGPVYAWALAGGSGTVGTNTTCPEVTP